MPQPEGPPNGEGEVMVPHSFMKFTQEMRKKLEARDRLRRKDFVTWTDLRFVIAMPAAFLPRMRRVPDHAIVEEREEEFLVECPCGSHPSIERLDEMFQKCPGCERRYLAADELIFVHYGAMEMPSARAIAAPATDA